MSNVIVSTQTNKNIVVTTAGNVINVTLRHGVPMPFPTPGPQGEKGDTGEQGIPGEKGDRGEQGNPTTVNGKTGESITLDKSDIGLGNADNTADADKPLSTAMQAALSGKAALVHTHIISDVTGLQTALDAKQGTYSYTPEDAALKQNSLTAPDSTHYPTTQAVAGALAAKADLVNGKVPLAQINDALIGNVHFKGLYSFTNGIITSDDVTLNGQPLPVAATANVGWYFIAQDNGTVDGTSFVLGDWLISNGALGWHKVDNTDAVSSVNGYTGNVLLTKADVGLGNVPNTDATNPANTVQTASYRFVSDTEKAIWNSKQATATTLAGYGITDAVDLYNPQTISGIKTWASGANSVAIGPNKMLVQITDNIHINCVTDIFLDCFTLHINGNNGILSSQSISFSAGKGLSFVNNTGGYTDLLPSASPVAAGYTVRMPNASGTIALVGDIPTTAAWSTITGTPTTLSGYGITDAYPLSGNPAGYLTTIPDLSGTYDTLTTNQTISGLKTYSNGIINTSTSTGWTHYNTVDQVTNPEYVQMYWTANRFFIQANKSGTGTLRTLYLISNSRSLSVNPTVSSVGAINAEGSANSIGGAIFGITGTFTNAANNGNGISILPTINQSGSGGYNAVYIAPYEQSAGSGNKLLINAGTQSAANDGGTLTTRFTLASNGRVSINSGPVNSRLSIGANTLSFGAWGTAGSDFQIISQTTNDSSTAAGATVSFAVGTSIGNPTFVASNATSGSNVTYTAGATLYIAGAPVAGTNTIITNSYSLYVAAGTSIFSGPVTIGGQTTGQASWLKVGTTTSKSYWGNIGISLATATSQTYTDTSSSDTVSSIVLNNIGSSTIAASNATTYTNASTLFIDAAPTAGTNVTITSPWSIYVAAGIAYFQSGITTSRIFSPSISYTTGLVGATGNLFNISAGTITDVTTATSGTVTNYAVSSFTASTLAASNTGVTYTNASTLYISAAPSAGTNVTITNPYSLYVGGGSIYFGNAGSILSAHRIGFTPNAYNTGVISTVGNLLSVQSGTITDNSTAASGSVSNYAISAFAAPTVAAANTSITYTNASTLYIAGAPAAGTNVTISNAYSLYVANGVSAFAGGLNTGGGFGSNLWAFFGGSATNGINNINSQFGGSSVIATRVIAFGSVSTTINANSGYASFIIASSPVTTAASGTHGVLASAVINPLGTVTSGGAAVTNTVSLYINGTATGGTTNWAVYSVSGSSYFGGKFGIGTTNLNNSQFTVSGTSVSVGAWGSNGVLSNFAGISFNDTSSSGTVALNTVNSFGTPALTANNATTYTNAATVYIAGAPSAGTNVTISNTYALYIASGSASVAGSIIAGGAITSSTNITANRATIGTTSTDGIIIQNNTAATSVAQVQYTPRLRFSGHAWNTTSLADNGITFIQEVQPAAGNPITGLLTFSSQINGGSVNAITTLSDTGTFTTVQHGWKSLSTDPTTSNIAAGTYQVYKNTTTGTVKLWVNDGGTLKSVTLT